RILVAGDQAFGVGRGNDPVPAVVGVAHGGAADSLLDQVAAVIEALRALHSARGGRSGEAPILVVLEGAAIAVRVGDRDQPAVRAGFEDRHGPGGHAGHASHAAIFVREIGAAAAREVLVDDPFGGVVGVPHILDSVGVGPASEPAVLVVRVAGFGPLDRSGDRGQMSLVVVAVADHPAVAAAHRGDEAPVVV